MVCLYLRGKEAPYITNHFKQSSMKIAFRTNSLQDRYLRTEIQQNNYKYVVSWIYQLTWRNVGKCAGDQLVEVWSGAVTVTFLKNQK
jgi:hypothetical protein